uniref:NAD(P)H oxidase (H2O2-forming) n=1 Tax=Setaria digitata TaxID=48799 RepID=A0A915PEP6_9BILA
MKVNVTPSPNSALCKEAAIAILITYSLERIHEYQRYDGWFNNLANPHWGTVGAHLHRDAPSRYQDGVYMLDTNLPSARAISELVFKGPSGIPNKRNVTTMLAFFSQVIAYEIMQSTLVSCPLEMHKIPVPRCDAVFDSHCMGKTEIPFVRAKYDKKTGHGFNVPREQVNERTSWIDASFLYSTQEPWVAALRAWNNGSLMEGPMKGYPPFNGPRIPLINPAPPQIHRLMNPERLFSNLSRAQGRNVMVLKLLGDPRINENPGLLSLGLILYRWHNIQAKRIQEEHPEWTDEEIFQGARRWVIATLQKITLYDFLPIMLADEKAVPPYEKYKPHVPPGISHAFATAAFRFPHTIVPSALLFRKRAGGKCEFRDEVGGYPALRLCQNWWNAQDIVQEYSVDEIVLGMASQIAEGEDSIVVEDLRDFIFGPMHFTRLDVVSSSIMRGRDNGLPSYNELRKSYNLPVKDWTAINPKMYKENAKLFHGLEKLYEGDISKLDAYVGGMLETNGDGPGELFRAIILDQFLRLRDGDRFWFENTLNGMLTEDEIAQIHSTTLRDIIRETTFINENELQENVFLWHDGDPCGQPFQVNASGLEPCVPFMRFDHFTGNEVTFIFSCIALGIIPLICVGIGYMVIQKRKKMGGDMEPCFKKVFLQSTNSCYTKAEIAQKNNEKEKLRLPAIEWISKNYCRSVVLIIDVTPSIRLEKPRGGLLRCLDLSEVNFVNIALSDQNSCSSPFVVISVPKHYDLVVRLHSECQCTQFLCILGNILNRKNKQLIIRRCPNRYIVETAETSERRQEKLDHFFREAYAKAFNISELSGNISPMTCGTIAEEVLGTTITKAEMANALGMLENDLFVQRMFACTAKEDPNHVTFLEFLGVVIRFAKGATVLFLQGSLHDKLELLFNMCDREGQGRVRRKEFCDFVKSLNVAVGVKIEEAVQNGVINKVLQRSGISVDSEFLSYKDFEAIFSNVDDIRHPVGVHMRGVKLKINLAETESMNSFAIPNEKIGCISVNWYLCIVSYLETYRQHIVILFLFATINLLLFFERFWHYRYETEHRDLRRVMGMGIAITRGAAASLSFCMGLILTTVCQNVITLLRETLVCEYVPLDSAITFHKVVAVVAGFWAALHSVGHCINFYHVATQSQDGLQCLFQEAVFGSNFLPSISYWFYGTITGITGILLVATMSITYAFSTPAVMKEAYHAFKITHLLNFLLYALTVLHGLPKLLDSPKFLYYVAGPIALFVIDRIIGMRQQYKELQILNGAILPSDIIYIQFKRPHSFRFRSGQWVRISCPAFSCTFNELHAFSLASAPQASTLELYIKAVGPWTWNLRNEIACSHSSGTPYPVLHLHGPYGGGNQEWRNFELAVLIGGGIGVTPYASILTDLVLEKTSHRHTHIKCEKVYFIWVCPTHKNFEWFIEVLRNVEELDKEDLLEIHIFVTQFFHKFDLRTTMLYICEKHFRSDSDGRSMFTGLHAANHFGRPDFSVLFKFIQNRHRNVQEIGVFSCGPNSLNKEVRKACTEANKIRNVASFSHRFETF